MSSMVAIGFMMLIDFSYNLNYSENNPVKSKVLK